MPQPKVSLGPSRSRTVIACDRSSRFIRSAKYRPAGPPPTTTMRIALLPGDRPAVLERDRRRGGLGVEVEGGRRQPPFAVAGERRARLVERHAIPQLARHLLVLLIECLAVVRVRAAADLVAPAQP